ncbi:MAG TPA: SpoIIE family protein phosphatase [Isosphaeraceae bacterium]
MPYLKRANGDPSGQLIELKGEEMVLGRLPECDVILDFQGVSRRHARIYRDRGQYYLGDLKSLNRTKVNDTVVEPGQDHQLRQGDRINICDVEFIYYTRPPKGAFEPDPAVLVTEEDDRGTIHTFDASSVHLSSVKPELKLRAILEITRNLSSELKIDAVAPKVLDSLFQLFPQSERAFLVLHDPATGKLVRKAFKHRPGRTPGVPPLALQGTPTDEPPMSISRSIVNHVLDNKKAVLSQDAGKESSLPTSASIADLKIRSVICAPLLTPNNQALGILQLDSTASKQFQPDDLELVVAVASQAAISIQNAQMHESLLARDRLDRDLRLAEQVQKKFLPQAMPKIPGYQFFAHYLPAFEVGGDYYDFVPLPNHRLAVALADVSGKGIAAALMMAKFSGDTRYCILTENAPAPAADALNQLLCAAGFEERFITLSLGILDLRAHHLTVCSAGHMPVLIRRADGRVEDLGGDSAGFPLGIMNDSIYQQVLLNLGPGDVVVVYSDGVTDARSPRDEIYDSVENRRLSKRVAEAVGGPEAVGRAILQDLREFTGGHVQFDDTTLICFGRV